MVVPKPEQSEAGVELRGVLDDPSVEFALQRAEEALDPPVLPRASNLGSLVANAHQSQTRAEGPGGEDGLVVGADQLGASVLVDGGRDLEYQADRRTIPDAFQQQAGARAMINDAQQSMLCPLRVAFAGQVDGPDAVDWHRSRPAVFEV